MKTFWENDGEPNAQGEYVAAVDMEDGGGVQRFKGTNHKEIADKLLAAQANATQKIREQQRQITHAQPPDPQKPGPKFERRALTADERFKLAQDVSNPATAPEAIRTVVEAEIGAPLETIRERMATQDATERAKSAAEEAKAFAEATPEFYSCRHNAQLLANYMQRMGMAPTRRNFAIAFDELGQAGLLVPRPDSTEADASQPGEETPNGELPAQSGVTTRRRGAISSTGIRAGDSTGTPGVRAAAPKYTKAQIEAMGLDEYTDKYRNEPGFREFVDGPTRQPAVR